MSLLSGRVVLVAGADHVPGRAAAAFFARAGAAVVLAGREAEALEAIGRDLLGIGATALPAPLDPDDRARADELVARVLERFGQLDVAVLFGAAEALLAAVVPVLAGRGRGQVILVAPPDPAADEPAGADRAAPLAATARRLAAETRGRGVAVTLVRPGPLSGELGLAAGADRLRPEDLAQAILSLAAFAPGVRPAELVLVPLGGSGGPVPGGAPGTFSV